MAPVTSSVPMLASLAEPSRSKAFVDAVRTYLHKGGVESVGGQLSSSVRNKITINFKLSDIAIKNAPNEDICMWVARLSAKPSGEQLSALLQTKLKLNINNRVDSESLERYFEKFQSHADLLLLDDEYLKNTFCKGLASVPVIYVAIEADRKDPSVDFLTLAAKVASVVAQQELASSTGDAILTGTPANLYSLPTSPTAAPNLDSRGSSDNQRQDQRQRPRGRRQQHKNDDSSERAPSPSWPFSSLQREDNHFDRDSRRNPRQESQPSDHTHERRGPSNLQSWSREDAHRSLASQDRHSRSNRDSTQRSDASLEYFANPRDHRQRAPSPAPPSHQRQPSPTSNRNVDFTRQNRPTFPVAAQVEEIRDSTQGPSHKRYPPDNPRGDNNSGGRGRGRGGRGDQSRNRSGGRGNFDNPRYLESARSLSPSYYGPLLHPTHQWAKSGPLRASHLLNALRFPT